MRVLLAGGGASRIFIGVLLDLAARASWTGRHLPDVGELLPSLELVGLAPQGRGHRRSRRHRK